MGSQQDSTGGTGDNMDDDSAILNESVRSFADGRSFESREGAIDSTPGLRDRLKCKKVQPGNLHLLSSKYEVGNQ